MAADQNPFAKIPDGLKTTAPAAKFVEEISFDAIPAEAVRVGTRCLVDGLGRLGRALRANPRRRGGAIGRPDDERYRGGPDNPLSDSDVEAKAYSCCEGNLDNAGQSALIDAAWSVLQLKDAGKLMALMNRLK